MGITAKGKAWERKNSLWILWPLLLSMGWIGFFQIGVRGKKRAWIVWGIVHLAVWLAVASSYVYAPVDVGNGILGYANTGFMFILGLFTMFGWIVQLIQLACCRREYLIRREALEANQDVADQRIRLSVLKGASAANEATVQSAAPIGTSGARVLDIDSAADAAFAQGGERPQKLDLNAATQSQLAALPCIGAEKANAALRLREQSGGFSSAQDMCDRLSLKPHEAVQICELAFASGAVASQSNSANIGRRVDV